MPTFEDKIEQARLRQSVKHIGNEADTEAITNYAENAERVRRLKIIAKEVVYTLDKNYFERPWNQKYPRRLTDVDRLKSFEQKLGKPIALDAFNASLVSHEGWPLIEHITIPPDENKKGFCLRGILITKYVDLFSYTAQLPQDAKISTGVDVFGRTEQPRYEGVTLVGNVDELPFNNRMRETDFISLERSVRAFSGLLDLEDLLANLVANHAASLITYQANQGLVS